MSEYLENKIPAAVTPLAPVNRLSDCMSALNLCVCLCAESCQQECVKQAAGLLSLSGSYLSVQIQELCWFVKAVERAAASRQVTVSHPKSPQCTLLHSLASFSVQLCL